MLLQVIPESMNEEVSMAEFDQSVRRVDGLLLCLQAANRHESSQNVGLQLDSHLSGKTMVWGSSILYSLDKRHTNICYLISTNQCLQGI